MKLVRQPQGSAWCFACCVAMIANTTLDDVIAAITRHLVVPDKHPLRGKPYLGLQDAIIYLAQHSYQYGASHHFAEPATFDCTDLVLQVTDALKQPAILTVCSGQYGEEHLHSVVWDPDTQTVLDPQCDQPQSLKSYRVREWALVTEFFTN